MTRPLKSSTVRRVLFPVETPEDQVASQNYFNNIQDNLDREVREKSQKWGFDFKQDRPIEGDYEWEHVNNENSAYKWVGRVKDKPENDVLQKSNEESPKTIKENVTIPKLKKRPLEDIEKIEDSCVRKKLIFE